MKQLNGIKIVFQNILAVNLFNKKKILNIYISILLYFFNDKRYYNYKKTSERL